MIPLLHFAVALARITRELVAGPSLTATYMFQESDNDLNFVRIGDTVQIHSTIDSASVEFPIAELGNAAKDFVVRLLDELHAEYPRLSDSPGMAAITARINPLLNTDWDAV